MKSITFHYKGRKSKNIFIVKLKKEGLYNITLFFFVMFRDVLPQIFESYSADVQKLICTADHLGALMQYDTLGFLPNLRIHRGQSSTKLHFHHDY